MSLMQAARPLLAAATALSIGSTMAAPIDIAVSSISVFNDNLGYSRFFFGAGTERLRVNTSVAPSPDSDYFTGSSNGNATRVFLTNPATEGFVQEMGFVGLTSGGGGSLNQFTTTFALTNPWVQSQLASWDATPFKLWVQAADTPSGANLLSFDAPDYDSARRLPFLNDVAISGAGLKPTLSWNVPETDASISNIRIQVRRIEADVPGRILEATLVHEANLALGTTSYTLDEVFSNGGIPGLPSGLESNRRYEVAVILESRDDGILKARARTFFEFTPIMDDMGGGRIYLPSVDIEGNFNFDVEVREGETILIDPVVAIGYDYQIGEGDPLFASVALPSIGDDLFELWLFDLTLGEYVFQTLLAAGEQFFFADGGVDRFRVLGIEASAGLDPSDVSAFVTALTFAGDGRFTGRMTPITVELASVPEPPLLGLIGVALLGLARRRGRSSMC